MNIDRCKRLIMESIPNEAGRKTNYVSLSNDVSLYCSELGYKVIEKDITEALICLHEEQCLVYFGPADIRPTQFGLNKYNSFY